MKNVNFKSKFNADSTNPKEEQGFERDMNAWMDSVDVMADWKADPAEVMEQVNKVLKSRFGLEVVEMDRGQSDTYMFRIQPKPKRLSC